MNVGTASLLIGVHQFIWHPVTVYVAWLRLYGFPSFRELICIIIHDWGYWGSPNMDGMEGSLHPFLAANLAKKLLGQDYYTLCLAHSRHTARALNMEASKLCYADKLSLSYDPKWFYLFRAHLSGEIAEYRFHSAKAGGMPLSATNSDWFYWLRLNTAHVALTKNPRAMQYMGKEVI